MTIRGKTQRRAEVLVSLGSRLQMAEESLSHYWRRAKWTTRVICWEIHGEAVSKKPIDRLSVTASVWNRRQLPMITAESALP